MKRTAPHHQPVFQRAAQIGQRYGREPQSCRDTPPDQRTEQKRHHHHDPERSTPPEGVGDPAANGDTKCLRQGQPEIEGRDGLALGALRRKRGHDSSPDWRDQTRPRRRQRAGDIKHRQIWREGGQKRAHREYDHPRRDHTPAPDTPGQRDQHRGQHGIGQRVDRQCATSRCRADAQIGDQQRHHANDDKGPHSDDKVARGQKRNQADGRSALVCLLCHSGYPSRGAAARLRRSFIAIPRPSCGIGETAIVPPPIASRRCR